KPRSIRTREAQSTETLSEICDSSINTSHPSSGARWMALAKLVTITTLSGFRAVAMARLTSSNIAHASRVRSSSDSSSASRDFAVAGSLTGISSAFIETVSNRVSNQHGANYFQ